MMVLKGIPLIYEVYKDVGARPLGDADILVRPQDGDRLTKMLLERGWRFTKEWAAERHNPSPGVYAITKASELDNGRGINVDLHFNIFAADHGRSLIDVFLLKDLPSLSFPDRFWEHTIPMELNGVPCLRLSDEDTLIHLIVHGSEGNTYRTFRWVLDAVLLINDKHLDWDLVLKHAEEFGYALDMRIALSYLKEVFGSPIPDAVLHKLASLPFKKSELTRYYRVANIEHSKRLRVLGNIPLLWYAYWKFEPKRPYKLLGFLRYVRDTWGLTRTSEIVAFAARHIARKLSDLEPDLARKVGVLSRDSLYVVAGKAISFLASFLVITLMARLLPREMIGSYNYIMAVLAIMSILTLPGMNDALMRAVGRGHDGSIHAMMRVRLLFGLGGSLLTAACGLAAWLLGHADIALAFLIAAPFVPLTDTFSNLAISYWQGKKQFGRSALVGAGYYLGLAALSTIVILLSPSLPVLVGGILLAQAVVGVAAYFSVWNVRGNTDGSSIRLGFHLTAMQAFSIVSSHIDKLVVWIATGPAMLAVYVFAATPVSKAYQMLPLNVLALPHLSAATHTIELRRRILRVTTLLFLLSVPGSLIIIWAAPFIYSILFPTYSESVPLFQLLFLTILVSPFVVLRSALVAFRETKALYVTDVAVPALRILVLAGFGLAFGVYGVVAGALLSSVIGSIATLFLYLRSKTVD